MNPPKCPECGAPWKDSDSIYQHFLNKYGDKKLAAESASLYGCTKNTPKFFSKNVIGIEITDKYDGVSYWECQKCKSIFDRWTLKKVDTEIK